MDIETKPAIVASFGIRDQHITHKQILKDGGVICVGLKWHGEKRTHVYSVWEHGPEAMLQATHDALCEADGVATYNGAGFDTGYCQPRESTRFASTKLADLGAPVWPKPTSSILMPCASFSAAAAR